MALPVFETTPLKARPLQHRLKSLDTGDDPAEEGMSRFTMMLEYGA
jgi:hypothetical protein